MSIDAKKIQRLISEASNVVIMAHKNLDLDSLGSSLGIFYICKSLGKNVFLLIEEETLEMGVSRSINELKRQKININIKTLNELKEVIDNKTLLIIVDVHIPSLTQNKEALAIIDNKIIIDHHIKDKEIILDPIYEYICEMKSSAAEIVIELIRELNVYIPSYVATIMLAGIVIDTNSFSIKTNHKTYESASFLHQQADDSKELQYLLKEDLNRYIQRQKIINGVEIIEHTIAIGLGDKDYTYYKEDLAKVSDTLLLFNHIECSFTIGKIDDNIVGISARSLGNIDVQKIMEMLDGGGHITDAATQLKDISITEARERLLEVIKK